MSLPWRDSSRYATALMCIVFLFFVVYAVYPLETKSISDVRTSTM